jgi:hypothetical protein
MVARGEDNREVRRIVPEPLPDPRQDLSKGLIGSRLSREGLGGNRHREDSGERLGDGSGSTSRRL